jgi:hypothetical protein
LTTLSENAPTAEDVADADNCEKRGVPVRVVVAADVAISAPNPGIPC